MMMNFFKKVFNVRIDPRIVAQLAKQKKLVVLGLVCSGLSATLASMVIPLVKYIISAVEHRDISLIPYLSLGIIFLFGTKYWFTRGQAYFFSQADIKLSAGLRSQMFQKLQKLPVSYFNEKRVGVIQSVLINDVNVYQNAIMVIKDSIEGPVRILIGVTALFWIQWKLALISLITLPALLFLLRRSRKKIQAAQSTVQHDLAEMTAMMQEALQGTRIIKAFGAEEKIIRQFEDHIQQSQKSQIYAAKKYATLKPSVELLSAVALSVTVFLSGKLAYDNQLSIAGLSAFLAALSIIDQGSRYISDVNQTLAIVQAATNRIYEQILDVSLPNTECIPVQTIPSPNGKIEFKNVSFVYPDGTKSLKDVSFVLESGQTLAMVGQSGAGKSTIADLLLKFYDPTKGTILFDGVDYQDLDTSWLRMQIGVVPQQTFLFAGSIAENIKLGKQDASLEEIKLAAKAAHAADFIEAMPNQYDTSLGERGVRLSGGEAQRIAIARALLRKPKILLLDEATSNLDSISEKYIQEALQEIQKERTCLFIAHRLSTAARADKIVMLRKGEIIEMGSHQELLAKKGAYAGMYNVFIQDFLEETCN